MMNCTKCQAVLEEGTTVCPNCGQVNTGQQTQEQTRNNQGTEQQGYAQYRGPVPMPKHVQKSMITIVVLAILEASCCTPLGGLSAIAFAFFARESFQAGDFAKFEKRKKYAIYCLIGGLILTVLCGGIYAVIMGFSALMELAI